MIRGTTPTLRFSLPFNASELSVWYVSFAQRGVEKFSIDKDHSTVSGSSISVTPTQADTLKLEADTDVQIQLRGIVQSTGEAIASEIMTTAVKPILREGVIT